MSIHDIDRRALLLGLSAAGFAGPALAQVAAGVSLPDVPVARPESVGVSSEGLAKIQVVMADFIARRQIQGGVTAVARKNRLVHYQAHGMLDPGAGVAMRPDAEFVMMSSTKPVTGVALLQQIEAGRVRLDDPISKYIPELKTMRGAARPGTPRPPRGQTYTLDQIEPQAREITIKDLATHTSGLNAAVPRRPGDTLATAIPRLKDTVLEFQPGSRWGYSAATGPCVLARVVEITSGQSYDQYLKEHIFDPIGMNDTRHNLSPEQLARKVKRYESKDGGPWTPARGDGVFDSVRTTYFAGSYGLTSTARDYMLFETMLLNKGTIHGKRVLKPESVELMHTNLVGDLYKGTGGTTKGTGFGVLVRVVLDKALADAGREVGAFGCGGAYGTMSWTDPKLDLVAAIMIQQPVRELQSAFEKTVRAAVMA